jgi:pimeloyl-ACP methyl ester carboxylesterase
MRLSYLDEGPGPCVVLLHGFPLNRQMWAEQVSALGSMYRIIAPDLRGHGESSAPDGVYTMDEMADDVIELIDTLHITERFVLGGLSMGGYVALSLVARYPMRVRGLMLLDTQAGPDTPEAAQNRETGARAVLEAGSASNFVAGLLPRLFSKGTLETRPERVEPLRAAMERTTPRGIAGTLRGMAIRPDRRSELPRIAIPTLALVGEDDVITPPSVMKAMADAIPNSRLEVVPKAGHLAPYENSAVSNEVILRYLKSLEARD